MIKNHLRLFIRNLSRQKLFSAINLLGLTVSISSTMLIYLYVRHEFSFDSFHHHADRLYRVNQTFIWAEDEASQFSRTGPGVAHALKEELPEVERITSLHTPGSYIVSYQSPSNEVISFEEDKVLAADSNFFPVLNFPLTMGNEATALRETNTLVMTKSTAMKYFGVENPIGKMVSLGALGGGQGTTYEVTGVMEDVPDNSTIEFDMLLSIRSFPRIEQVYWSWVWTQLETFVLLRPDANIANVRKKLEEIPRKRAEESIKGAMGVTYDEYIKSGRKWELFLQPVTSLHLPEAPVVGSFPDVGNIKIIYSLIGAAIFIVLLSCVNFMNLTTAQFTRRVREVGIRKVLGLDKRELRLSIFLEAFTFCLAGIIFGTALIQMLLPVFNVVTGKHLSLSLIEQPSVVVVLLALALFIALSSGLYPAVWAASFSPVNALRGKSKFGGGGMAFRNGLVVFQFSVSIVLVVCTAVVFQQLKYVSDKDLGFDKANLVVLHHTEAIPHSETLTGAILSISHTVNASWCTSVPPKVFGGDTFSAEGMSDQKLPLNYTMADEHYIPTLDVKLLFGRNFRENSPADSNRVVLNESAVRKIGWEVNESTLGKYVTYPNSGSDLTRFEVIGIVSDFNYWSISMPIEPLAIFNKTNTYIGDGDRSYVVVKVDADGTDEWNEALASLQRVWREQAPNTPFQYSFVDKNFEQTFATQLQFGKILTVMSALGILIAALGLLGIVVYSLEQRTKEIGIRKVTGASVGSILLLISSGYTRLLLVAFVIGAPAAYFLMDFWLKDFAYRISPSVWIFISACAGTLLLALLTTLYHSLKAALTNPVDVLRDE